MMNKKQSSRITVEQILRKKRRHQKITMLTAYDYPLASLVDKAAIDIILVGDSLANVILGLESTCQVGMEEMIHHTKAVNRAVKNAMLIGDMPFGSYQANPESAVKNARRFIEEAGCNGVKLEWFERCLETAEGLVKAGIAVMGHVGLTPQTADKLGGLKVQGKDAHSARSIIQHAKDLEKKGCFSIVLECIPENVARIITSQLSIPTIGIGSGVHCDGQVLVTYDLLGLVTRYRPKFVKQYLKLNDSILKAIVKYRQDVLQEKFPSRRYSFQMDPKEAAQLNEGSGSFRPRNPERSPEATPRGGVEGSLAKDPSTRPSGSLPGPPVTKARAGRVSPPEKNSPRAQLNG